LTATVEHAYELSQSDRLFIGGEWVTPSTSAVIKVINPTTEELFLTVAEASAEDMHRAVTAARVAFDDGPWPRLSHAERSKFVYAFAAGIREHADEIATIQASQMGIPWQQGKYSALWSADRFTYYADMADDFPFIERREPTDGGKVGLLVREPVGVIGAIIPWNSPITLIAPRLAPALLAGCTMVVKSSPEAPGEAYIMAQIAQSIGLPPGVFNVVTADREVSELLVRDARVNKINFTGSSAIGRRISAIMADRIGRVTLELGGKSAAIVLDDYDLAEAAATLGASGCRMTGQVCASLTRIIVPRKRHDDFVDALKDVMSQVKVGDPFDPETEMGPLVTSRQRDIVEGFLAKGKQEGSKLVLGGGRPSHLQRGFFIEPTLYADVDNNDTVAREEIFGPVLTVIAADDERHAVKIANDSIYGLNASVFSNDVNRVYEVARRLQSGTVGHNAFRGDFGIAFGGFKQSGIGREGGREGLYECLETKTIILDDEPAQL